MNKTKGLLSAAGLVLAITFTFSCSGDDGGDNNTSTCGGKKYDITYYSCESGELVGSCRGKPYYPEFESCENGEIIDGAEISSSSSRNSSSSGGSLNMSDLPKQVYLVETDYDDNDNLIILKKERYNGNVNVSLHLSKYRSVDCSYPPPGYGEVTCECTSYEGVVSSCKYEDEYDTIPAGKIQNGQLSLNLPAINSKYLGKFEPCNDEYCQSNISVVPRNLTFTRTSSLEAPILDKKECYLRPYRTKSGETNRARFFYFSESGSITGTETQIHSDGQNSQTNFDMNFSKGWNLVYYDVYESNQNHNYYRTYTTDIPKDGTWEWWLQCSDEDNSGGGGPTNSYLSCEELQSRLNDGFMGGDPNTYVDNLVEECMAEHISEVQQCNSGSCAENIIFACISEDENMKTLCGGNDLETCGNYYGNACEL